MGNDIACTFITTVCADSPELWMQIWFLAINNGMCTETTRLDRKYTVNFIVSKVYYLNVFFRLSVSRWFLYRLDTTQPMMKYGHLLENILRWFQSLWCSPGHWFCHTSDVFDYINNLFFFKFHVRVSNFCSFIWAIFTSSM